MKANSTPLRPLGLKQSLFFLKKSLLLSLFAILFVSAKLNAQVATLTAGSPCNGDPFNLVLSSVTPTPGGGPYDLIINGTTFIDVPVGGKIIPPGSGPSEKLFPDADPSPIGLIHGNDGVPVELGVKFSSLQAGYVTGIRFFSPPTPAGTYTGNLWTSSGTVLATAVFTVTIGSAWQEVSFATPVLIDANTTYIASYNSSSGNYEATLNYFNNPLANGSLRSPQGVGAGDIGGGIGNGLYSYTGGVPNRSNNDANYWVDVRFVPFPLTETLFAGGIPAALPPSFNDDRITEVGVKFSSSQAGFVKGIRFFSHNAPTGTYTGHLWKTDGTLLATAVFNGVTASSWQEVSFSTAVPIAAGDTYIASYNTSTGRYAATTGFFTAAATNGSLSYPAGAGPGTVVGGGLGNGVYTFVGAFPDSSNNDANYWVDVRFVPSTYTFTLTSVTDALGSENTTPQTLTVTACSTLPVTLTTLSATPKDNSTVILQWSTSSESNNRGFEIQRSTDGRNWSMIGFVNGAGNSSTTMNYSYKDENLSARHYYYRLKQIDIDNRFVYSPTVSAILDGKETFVLEQNYPNPFRNETILKFTLPRASKVNLSLFDMNGRLVKTLINGSKESGTHAISFNAGSLSSGLYYYRLQTGDFSAVKKMTIQ